jgi:adenine-specific DNA methylase
VLARATLLGLLIPASGNYALDRDIFLKLMIMDEEGLWRRKNKAIPQKRLLEELLLIPPSVRLNFLGPDSSEERPRLRIGLTREERENLQQLVFSRMPYSEKLRYCCRPEQIDGPSPETWESINDHLGTTAYSLAELVEELGTRRFGRRPRVGDCFCGAGSIPFEAARLGCDPYASDLNPIAALLTWTAFNIVGGDQEMMEKVHKTQTEIFEAVDRQISEWGIEHNENGWRADAYLYCVEVRDPESGWLVPVAPSWVVGERTRSIARLVPDPKNMRYEIEIHEGVSDEEMRDARESGTVKNSRLVPPNGGPSTPIDVVRRNLRMWENEDLVSRPDDVFLERLYCIRWVETYYEIKKNGEVVELTRTQAKALADFQELLESGKLKEKNRRHYRAPEDAELKHEQKALELLRERFHDWQAKGYIPSRRIESGAKTDEPIRTRGWTYWHHMFTPRQLLVLGLFSSVAERYKSDSRLYAMWLLGINRLCNYNSRLSRWDPSSSKEMVLDVFSNQALNTNYNFGSRALQALSTTWLIRLRPSTLQRLKEVKPIDARSVNRDCDIWISDPPYADAINYHELSEFFLAWCESSLISIFSDWYTDSKRALAIQGEDESFRHSMIECYRQLLKHMPNNGLQVVMFTHQDAAVWADLTLILWAAGLRVTAAWCIATETDSALKQGNYVQGTVLLVLRKRTEEEAIFLDEIAHRVEAEVKRQLDTMLELEDESDPNFGDADYQLAAYAAALRVLTERPIEEIDPAKEILRVRMPGEINLVEQVIRNAVKIACDHLVPHGIETDLWKTFSSMERFYLKGLEVESHGEYRSGVYQELARGFGATDYADLLASSRANQTRLKTAVEFDRRMLSGDGFARSLVRQVLFAVHQVAKNEQTRDGLNWLRTELPHDYWPSREKIIHILDYLAVLGRVSGMTHWEKDAEAARLLAGAVRNDHV